MKGQALNALFTLSQVKYVLTLQPFQLGWSPTWKPGTRGVKGSDPPSLSATSMQPGLLSRMAVSTATAINFLK